MSVSLNFCVCMVMVVQVLLCLYWINSQSENQISEIRALLFELQEKIEKTDIKYNELFHQTNKAGAKKEQERPSTLSGVKNQDQDENMEIKYDDYKTNKKQSYNLDKEGGNDEQKTHVSQYGVKDEDGKVDMEPNEYNTNTQQCNCQDKKGETDNHKEEEATVTWWSWMKNLGIQTYGLLTVFNNLCMGVLILCGILENLKQK